MIDKEYYFSLCKDAELNQEKYIEQAKSQSYRWEYTGWKRYDSTPFWFERNLEPRSPVMDCRASISYGFNKNDEICFIQSSQEECIVRTEERMINRRYSNGKVDSIEELIFDDGLPVKYVEFIVRNGLNPGQEWHFEEEYVYEGKKLVEIKRNEFWYAGNLVRTFEFQIEYDETGNMASIKENGDVKYREVNVEQAKQIRDEVKKELIDESIRTITKIGDRIQTDQVCFIGIYLHGEPSGILDPIFHPGLQSIRDEQIEAGEDIWTIWNAGEHPVENQESLSDQKVKEKFQLLIQYWQMNSDWSDAPLNPVLTHKTWWGESKALWQEVALELNKMNWDGILPVTKTFVIYADEESLDVPGGDLAKSVPGDKLRILESKGLVSLV
ncbi:hypothetical protein [Paenibacillus turpanensis]|uniref:hypothetical protein n=1 Tax=Paenibacillus turpanensis TaxID=2689078 RepID=UPI001409439B|nr:hypothetical protein [Paenibacillus turpanensis]